MDSRPTTHQGSLGRLFAVVGAAFLYWSSALDCHGNGPPPKIRSNGKSQQTTQINPLAPTVFPEQGWNITAPNPLGPTYAMWTIEPFQSLSNPSMKVDAALNLRMLRRGNRDNWQVIIPQARTQWAQGRMAASVAAGSEGGNGEAGITVTFLGQEQSLVVEGIYEATVVGTISEPF